MEDKRISQTSPDCLFSKSDMRTFLTIIGSVGSLSILVCSIAICLVPCMKLHKRFLYRLGMDQVVSSLLLVSSTVLMIFLSEWYTKSYFSGIICPIIGVLVFYLFLLNSFITSILTFHLFSLAVFSKSLRNAEVFYIIFAALLPLLFIWVPIVSKSYGPIGALCKIKYSNNNISGCNVAKRDENASFLWYGLLLFFLSINLIMALMVFIVLIKWWCVKRKVTEREPLLPNATTRKYRNAILELLPLLAYSGILAISTFLCTSIYTSQTVYKKIKEHSEARSIDALTLVLTFSIVLWGFLSGGTLLVHILLARYLKKETQPVQDTQGAVEHLTIDADLTTSASTRYFNPTESELSEEHNTNVNQRE